MDKQTNDFIISLKRHIETEDRFGDYYINATAEYLSNMSGTPIEHYNKSILYSYIQSAFKDFMSTADSRISPRSNRSSTMGLVRRCIPWCPR